jgi:Protein of unknown function (DUF3551)
MRTCLLIAAVFATGALLGHGPAHAYGEGPWCAVESLGSDSMTERCTFADFETCRREVVAGNRGYCNSNPRWAARVVPASPRRKIARRHHGRAQ